MQVGQDGCGLIGDCDVDVQAHESSL
jgi:hypothetical protein